MDFEMASITKVAENVSDNEESGGDMNIEDHRLKRSDDLLE
jgi:hypothetical protein